MSSEYVGCGAYISYCQHILLKGHIQWCASILRRCISILPTPNLDVQIFVTNYLPYPESGPSKILRSELLLDAPTFNGLLPPSPQFVRDIRSRSLSISPFDSMDSLVNKSSSLTIEPGDENSIPAKFCEGEDYGANLTNFNGDNEAALSGEEFLNIHIKTTGNARRAKRRKLHKSPPEQEVKRAVLQARPYHYNKRSGTVFDRPHSESVDTLFSLPQPSQYSTTNNQKLNSARGLRDLRKTSTDYFQQNEIPLQALTPLKNSISSPCSHTSHPAARPSSDTSGCLSQPLYHCVLGNQPRLRVNERDLDNMSVVAEYARPGKPAIHQIIGDEVEEAKGSIIVACKTHFYDNESTHSPQF